MASFVDLSSPRLSGRLCEAHFACTASAAPHTLPEHDEDVLSDLFPSVRALSQAVRDPERQIAYTFTREDEMSEKRLGGLNRRI